MAFQQGLSGLSVSAKSLDLISNNIANASTVGFKGGQAQFADVYSASLGVGGGAQVGAGASVLQVQQQFTQGNISSSNNPLDIAINGSGFFRLQKSETVDTITYTRNGQFHVDATGAVVNAQGDGLTGNLYDVDGNLNLAKVPIVLNTTGDVPLATGAGPVNPGVQVQINMDDRDAKSLTSAVPNKLAPWSSNTSFPPSNLNTFNYSTSATIYDQKGNDHTLSMYFTRVGNSESTVPAKNLWQVHYVLDDKDVTSQVDAATSGNGGVGVPSLEFAADGTIVKSSFGSVAGIAQTETLTTTTGDALAFVPATTPVNSLVVTSQDGATTYVDGTDYSYNVATGQLEYLTIAPGTSISVSYTTDATAMGSDYKFNINVADLATAYPELANLFPNDIPIDFGNSTLFGSGYDVHKLAQDGYPFGRLSGVSVSSDGTVVGNYSNGQTKSIAKILLTDFVAPTGLMSLGNNQWAETAASGAPLDGDPGTGNRGVLQSTAVEDANIDLAQELVNLITAQRNYQANAQSIKTQDQLMQTLINLR